MLVCLSAITVFKKKNQIPYLCMSSNCQVCTHIAVITLCFSRDGHELGKSRFISVYEAAQTTDFHKPSQLPNQFVL